MTSSMACRVASAFLILLLSSSPLLAEQKIWRIMPVGDSITEGGASFSVYRFPLWEKLTAAGYNFEFVGTKSAPTRIGPLSHEGYGGKNAEFLASTVPAHFAQSPADILLIHAGHNHSVEENPIPSIITATESLITSCRRVNPKLIVLVARPIPSAKLPKYSYLPALGDAIAAMARRLNTSSQPVIAVDQAHDFDPAKETVADKVHPNPAGAEKMARRWFDALTPVMGPLPASPPPRILPYKSTPQGDLSLHIFSHQSPPSSPPRPAIIFFFGGGWSVGSPLQFYQECARFASCGFVAITADYRISSTHKSTPFDSVSDAKSAIRWIRQHSREWNIDPSRIAAAGASAGGHLAAATGTLSGLNDPSDDLTIPARPDALILFYPVIDNGPTGFGDATVKARFQEISPLHNLSATTPPTLIILGTADKYVPVATARSFQAKLKDFGVPCQLELIKNAGHPIFEYRKGHSPLRDQMIEDVLSFLGSIWKSGPSRRF